MEKTKPELITVVRNLMKMDEADGHDGFGALLDNLKEAEDYLMALAQFARSAHVRELSAAAALALESQP